MKMKKTIAGLSAAVVAMVLTAGCATGAGSHHAHWDYDEKGPSCWGEFSTTCADGKAQSPIDIVTADIIPLESGATLTLNEDACAEAKVVDNGHSIKVAMEEAGSATIGGVEYKLLQFHFHGYSEHTVDGKQYDLVAHLVHQNKDGGLGVVGVLFEEGEANPFLDKVLKNVGKETLLNVDEMLPAESDKYFHYQGSLTTPPCSEEVQWYVLKEPVTASKEQLAAFRSYYDHNYRPVQPLNGRKVQAN